MKRWGAEGRVFLRVQRSEWSSQGRMCHEIVSITWLVPKPNHLVPKQNVLAPKQSRLAPRQNVLAPKPSFLSPPSML